MPIKLPYTFCPIKDKRQAMIDVALKDPFFEPIVHDLIDYGHDITFPFFGGVGAYQPFAVSTEVLDTQDKQIMFAQGFASQAVAGAFKAKFRLSIWFGRGGNAHSFLHELMHFYQDMLGLLLMPLKEQGVMPIIADLRTSVIALLFCEAWAEVEALRTCWSLKTNGVDDAPWKGALNSPDWGGLARFYDARLCENKSEAWAAARTFEQWYKGRHRDYYEFHAIEIYESELVRVSADIDPASKTGDAIKEHLRSGRIPALLKKIPQDAVPKYFELIDWENAALNEPQNDLVLGRCDDATEHYGAVENYALHEIKCASPPYLWKQLRMAEIKSSQVPPQSTMQFEHKG
jgi:hypothetical protein